MSPRSLVRPVALLSALVAAVGLVVSLAPARPAAALPLPLLSGLEQVVGPLSPAVLAQLPADPRLSGPYATRPTGNGCPDGASSCVAGTIADMTGRFDRLAPACDHDAVFALLYLRVTQRYQALAATQGFFADPTTVNREDKVFYDLYAGAYDDWHAGRPGQVAPIWRLAFSAADARQVTGLGDVLLGMAGHILRDLPFALYRIDMGSHADHLQVNTMLQQVYNAVVDELSARFDPLFQPGDVVPGSNVLVVDAIATWREKAWSDAQQLIAAAGDPARFQAVANQIEASSWSTGLSVYLAARYPVQALTVTRDTYCATHWDA